MAGIWIEVDLDAIVANYKEVQHHLKPGARCMAVVKADAYGLGAVEVAKALEGAGCEAFAVTRVEEGLDLREQGLTGLILVLGPSAPEEWPRAIAAGLQLTISDVASIEKLQALCAQMTSELQVGVESESEEEGKISWNLENVFPVQVHLKVETGLGRTGFQFSELEALAERLHEAPQIQVAGVYTHFARAAQRDKAYTMKQYERFRKFVDGLAELEIRPLWKHVCNSAAFLDYAAWQHDFVRIGTLLIGHYPGQGFAGRLTLRDPWIAKSRITQLRKVPKGTYVGYQSIYRTKSETQLAVIPVGYADGFGVAPHFTPQGWLDFLKILIKNLAALCGVFLGQERIVLRGKTVQVAGKIGMQLTVIDVGRLDCVLGDEVEIPLRRTVANPRIPRRYRREGQIFLERVLKEGVEQLQTEGSLPETNR